MYNVETKVNFFNFKNNYYNYYYYLKKRDYSRYEELQWKYVLIKSESKYKFKNTGLNKYE